MLNDAVVERSIGNSNFHLISSPVDAVTFGDVFFLLTGLKYGHANMMNLQATGLIVLSPITSTLARVTQYR
ncbi:MAG: hypothetical protein IPH20_09480 [Bacteroidales bacterium]|nr:hypothetical protein [Bacteroidales bacterium]